MNKLLFASRCAPRNTYDPIHHDKKTQHHHAYDRQQIQRH